MESWRKVWRDGLAPILPTGGLKALAQALESDDPALIQGATTTPPPLLQVQDWEATGACCIGFPFWKDGKKTVAEIEAAFAQCCYDCDKALGEPASARWLISWWDEVDRESVRLALLPEVKRELARRG